jgi:hypothetical protein
VPYATAYPPLTVSSRSSFGNVFKRNQKTVETAKRNQKTVRAAKRENNVRVDVCTVSEVERSESNVCRKGYEKYEKIGTVCVCACGFGDIHQKPLVPYSTVRQDGQGNHPSLALSRSVSTNNPEANMSTVGHSCKHHSRFLSTKNLESIAICPVNEKGKTAWMNHGHGKVTIDSGAEESVWPIGLLKAERLAPTKNPRNFVAANGSPLKHYGEKVVNFKPDGQLGMASMRFQVSDVTKPLASVARIVEKGNVVQFGAGQADSFIKNVATGRKIPLHRENGSFVLNVEYLVEEDVASLDFPRQES